MLFEGVEEKDPNTLAGEKEKKVVYLINAFYLSLF